MTTIGFVGLGAMGTQIAGRLVAEGYPVFGTNRTRSKADALVAAGMIWCDSSREVAEAADVIISMVTDDDALTAVTGGADGILAGLAAGKDFVDMSTVAPDLSRELAKRVAERGASMLAAPVSGSVPAAHDGNLAIMVGGDASAFERVEPILRQLGSSVTFVGDNGQALLLKLAINISLGVQMLAFSEGVLLAERGGIPRELAVQVMTGSAIGSPMLRARAPLVVEQTDEAWFDLRMMQKDFRLALDSARELKVPLPSTSVADELLTTARALGYERHDIAVLLRVLSDLAAEDANRKLGPGS
jgi:3-hydroxyisobutyrate dehydrogenase-like beta-hydroxyacid dehydrogenase